MKGPQFLVDTDWIIDHFNRVAKTTARLKEAEKDGLAVSIVSLAELWEGIWFADDRVKGEMLLRKFLGGVQVLDIDEETCVHFGRIRGELRRTNQLFGDFDIIIGATALRHGLTLLSNNRKHFGRIHGLRIESI